MSESFTVLAESEGEALELVQDGDPSVKIGPMEWLDWASDEYVLEDEQEELSTFLNSKVTV